jgi:hypothetical protein
MRLPVLEATLGQVIAKIRRIHYAVGLEIDTGTGSVELRFEMGDVLLLSAGSDAESLEISTHPWRDPFDGPLDFETMDFIKENGQYMAIDVSAQPEYAQLIGATVTDVEEIHGFTGKLVGAVLHSKEALLRVEIESDECYVAVQPEE